MANSSNNGSGNTQGGEDKKSDAVRVHGGTIALSNVIISMFVAFLLW